MYPRSQLANADQGQKKKHLQMGMIRINVCETQRHAGNQMKNHKTCRSELVAQSSFSSITVCPDCNIYHLHIGPMSFRMEADVFQSVGQMIVEYFVQPDLKAANREVSGVGTVKH